MTINAPQPDRQPATTATRRPTGAPSGLPDGVELRHLVAVHTVAELGSFGRAAEELGYTQSAISQQVATAEKRLGVRLFDRPGGPKAVEPTAAGALVAERVAHTLAGLDALADDLASLAAGRGGRVTLGTFQSISVRVLPALVTLARHEMPNVEIRVVESHHYSELEDRLARGELDL
ncbi:MAG: LysR family transcriptional regulator, partial [Microthrixaceae bacterium]|nr:LysR family transcriptional regulator [Microthrixaceae bacterium]